MNDLERKKQIGREFIQRLQSKSNDALAFDEAIKQFASDSLENRVTVAMGLLAIGADVTERPFDRNFALAQLGLFTRTCGLRNNEELQQQLSDIIDEWLSNQAVTSHDLRSVDDQVSLWGILLALGAVNPLLSLEKCDRVIARYGESEIAQQVRKLRATIEQSNQGEKS